MKKVWMCLYRTIDFRKEHSGVSVEPDTGCGGCQTLLVKALQSTACSAPQASTVDQKGTQVTTTDEFKATRSVPKAIADLKATEMLAESVELRQVKYLNNLVEQDRRFIKRLVKPAMGFFSFQTAWRTIQGYEVMNMIRKGQIQGVVKEHITGQIAFVARLFGVAA